jgi:hypothetical protein
MIGRFYESKADRGGELSHGGLKRGRQRSGGGGILTELLRRAVTEWTEFFRRKTD